MDIGAVAELGQERGGLDVVVVSALGPGVAECGIEGDGFEVVGVLAPDVLVEVGECVLGVVDSDAMN